MIRKPMETDDALAMLAEEIPEMPEGLHESWVQAVRNTPNTETHAGIPMKKPAFFRRPQFRHALAAAAAVIFVLGGTLLTRDALNPQPYFPASKSAPSLVDYTSGYTASSSFSAAPAGGAAYRSVAMDTYAAEEAAEVPADYAANGASGRSANAPAVITERKVVRNVSLSMTAADPAAAVASLRERCTDVGGYVASVNEKSTGRATLTLRIPAERLDEFLDNASEGVRITSRQESAEDVTDSYRDTSARLNSRIAMRDRLLTLLAEAKDMDDILTIESKLSDVQYEIDYYTGVLQSTDNKVSYSTVTITITQEKPEEQVTDTTLTLGQRIVYAFTSGWSAFTGFVSDLAVFLVAALPFIAVIAVIIVIIKHRRKRRGR